MYACDCDGIRRDEPLDRGRGGDLLRIVVQTIERVAHIAPSTCPWRAYSEPIVREVMAVAWAIDPPNLSTALGPDPDHKLVQAIGIYRRAKLATEADETKLRAEERDQDRKARAAAANAERHG